MKLIGLYICLLFAVVWGWNTAADVFFSETTVKEEVCRVDDKASQQVDRIVSVLVAANSCADISVQPVRSYAPQMARRYRPAGFRFDKCFLYQAESRKVLLDRTFKNILFTSGEYAALQKYAGYFVYTLRRIII